MEEPVREHEGVRDIIAIAHRAITRKMGGFQSRVATGRDNSGHWYDGH